MESRLFAFTGIVMLVTMVMHASSVRVAPSRFESDSPRCDSQSCIEGFTSNAYSNLFQSAAELENLKDTFQAARVESLIGQGYMEGNLRHKRVVYQRPRTLVDLSGNPKHIVHDPSITDYEDGVGNSIPTTYQHIPFAKCVKKGRSCKGRCIKEPIWMQILVYDSSSRTNMTFAWFAVPGYCSCKNISGWFWGGSSTALSS